MPALAKGSIYKVKRGFGIRWFEDGRMQHKSPFTTKTEAFAWFQMNVAPRLYGSEAQLYKACKEICGWARKTKRQVVGSWIYVIAAPDLQRVKIGTTTLPERRIRDLRTAAPLALVPLLLIPGDEITERKLHEVTKPFAIAGTSREWRTIEALEVVLAFVREQAGRSDRPNQTSVVKASGMRFALGDEVDLGA